MDFFCLNTYFYYTDCSKIILSDKWIELNIVNAHTFYSSNWIYFLIRAESVFFLANDIGIKKICNNY